MNDKNVTSCPETNYANEYKKYRTLAWLHSGQDKTAGASQKTNKRVCVEAVNHVSH